MISLIAAWLYLYCVVCATCGSGNAYLCAAYAFPHSDDFLIFTFLNSVFLSLFPHLFFSSLHRTTSFSSPFPPTYGLFVLFSSSPFLLFPSLNDFFLFFLFPTTIYCLSIFSAESFSMQRRRKLYRELNGTLGIGSNASFYGARSWIERLDLVAEHSGHVG